MIWISIKWKDFINFDKKSNLIEIFIGMFLLLANFTRNIIGFGSLSFGLVDMLVIFVALSIAFFGIRSLKFFTIPIVYLSILIVAYQIEFALESVRVLEFALAGFMGSFLTFFGIETSIYGNIVQLFTLDSNYYLMIDAPCTGIKGMLAYGSLAVLMIVDVKAPIKKKIFITVLGLVGTFLVNIFRLIVIFLTIYFINIDVGLLIHTYLGYSLFIVWVFIFWILAFRFLESPKPIISVEKMITK
jgi:exosortase/archaeosortase family protein